MRINKAITAAGCALLLVSCGETEVRPQTTEDFSRAQAMFLAGDASGATDILLKLTAGSDNLDDVYLLIGRCYLETASVQSAISSFSECIKRTGRKSTEYAARFYQAIAYQVCGDGASAIMEIENVTRYVQNGGAVPVDGGYLFFMNVSILARNNKMDDAVRIAHTVKSKFPGSPFCSDAAIFESEKKFVIMTGYYSDRALAEREMKALAGEGRSPRIAEVNGKFAIILSEAESYDSAKKKRDEFVARPEGIELRIMP